MKKSRSGYEETLGSNLVELPADDSSANQGSSPSANQAKMNGVKETSPTEDLAQLIQSPEE